jgi:hypothetical protein
MTFSLDGNLSWLEVVSRAHVYLDSARSLEARGRVLLSLAFRLRPPADATQRKSERWRALSSDHEP